MMEEVNLGFERVVKGNDEERTERPRYCLGFNEEFLFSKIV